MSRQNSSGPKKDDFHTLAVVGAGPAGIFAAVTAAGEASRAGKRLRISVYDKNALPARKILVSGNGRCNLSNAAVSAAQYPGCSAGLFEAVYRQFPNEALIAFFKKNGLPLRADAAGRLYPHSMQAGAVYDILIFLCKNAGVALVPDTEIVKAEKRRGGFLLNGSVPADRVIFACGSPAAPRNGGRDSLALIRQLGVPTVPFLPALSPLRLRQFSKNQLKGVRADGEIAVFADGRRIAADRGELQYTEYGLSGIPSMQVSGAAARAAADGAKLEIAVDSLPDLSDRELREYIDGSAATVPEMPASAFFSGLFPKRLAVFFLKAAGIAAETSLGALTLEQKEKIVQAVKGRRYAFEAVCGFADAQVATGGVPAAALDFDSLELTGAPGCYVCGEMADIAGLCGGYNLQWAWSSGYVAGKHAAEGLR